MFGEDAKKETCHQVKNSALGAYNNLLPSRVLLRVDRAYLYRLYRHLDTKIYDDWKFSGVCVESGVLMQQAEAKLPGLISLVCIYVVCIYVAERSGTILKGESGLYCFRLE